MTPDIRPGIGGLLDILPGVLTTVAGPAAGFEDRLGLADDLAGIRRVAVLLVDGFGYQLMPAAAAVGPTLDDISQGRIPRQFIPAVEDGVRAAAEHGGQLGFPFTNVIATLYDGQYHDANSLESTSWNSWVRRSET